MLEERVPEFRGELLFAYPFLQLREIYESSRADASDAMRIASMDIFGMS